MLLMRTMFHPSALSDPKSKMHSRAL